MNNATPTEYVWKYNPLSGIPAGAQQNYGATINWIIPGGAVMTHAIEDIQRRTLSPAVTREITARFEAESDQQPYAGARESNYIAANVLDSGYPTSGLYPLDLHGMQRVQLSGGRAEGRVQMVGGKTEGRTQLSGGMSRATRAGCSCPRMRGANMTGNGLPDQAEVTSDARKYFLRTDGPSQVVEEPGVFTQRQFMTTFLPAVVVNPFSSRDPASFPGQFSAIYKGRTAFEDVFYDW